LKYCIKQGYKVKFIEGIEFSKAHIFNKYVEKKKNAKLLAKMQLNTLYGSLELIETRFVNYPELKL
jgi:hypothetical protein